MLEKYLGRLFSFKYEPLDPNRKEIRLLVFEGGVRGWNDPKRPLRASLKTVSLLSEPSPAYYAVSYAWGENPPLQQMLINGRNASIPAPAIQALRTVCHPIYGKRNLPVWIDAICIDQANNEEKNHQVAMMGELYMHAKEVLVYLGEEDKSTQRGFQAMREVLHARSRGIKVTESFFPSASTWADLIKFFDTTYFKRLWPVQEISLCSSATIWRGEHFLAWIDMQRVIAVINSFWHGNDRFYAYNGVQGAIGALLISNFHNYSSINILRGARYFQTADPRDKIYAILGLLNRSTQSDIWGSLRPDYALPVAEVFVEATLAAIHDSGDLEILGAAQSCSPHFRYLKPEEREHDTRSVPSWVPRYDLNDSLGSSYIGIGSADADLLAEFNFVRPGGRATMVQGLEVCTIEWVNAHIVYLNSGDRTARRAVEFLGDCFAGLWNMAVETDNLASITSMASTHTVHKSAPRARNIEEPENTADFAAFMLGCKSRDHEQFELSLMQAGALNGNADRFVQRLANATFNRHFALTSSGHHAMAPLYARPGDLVCIIAGCPTPLVLRPKTVNDPRIDGQTYQLVGDVYVYGIMHGEYVTKLREEGRLEDELKPFYLIQTLQSPQLNLRMTKRAG